MGKSVSETVPVISTILSMLGLPVADRSVSCLTKWVGLSAAFPQTDYLLPCFNSSYNLIDIEDCTKCTCKSPSLCFLCQIFFNWVAFLFIFCYFSPEFSICVIQSFVVTFILEACIFIITWSVAVC